MDETVVWYGGPPPPPNGNWNSPGLAAAQAVFAQLQGPVILGYNPKEVTPGALVTLQTGTDVTVRPTPHTTTHKKTSTTSTTLARGTTTTTVYDPPGVKTNNQFSAPSSVNTALAPYDPRACNAAGTGPLLTTTTKPVKKK